MEHEDLEALMQEPPNGENFGKAASSLTGSTDPVTTRTRSLSIADAQVADMWHEGGFTVEWPGAQVHAGGERIPGTKGLPHSRSILTEGEYVDKSELQLQVEAKLGFTYGEVREIYGARGKPTADLVARRRKLDEKLLAIYESGGNMFQFAEIVGINQRTMNRALVRARSVS